MATTRIPPDFKEFLKLLKAHDVRFLLVGGYAVNAFGYIRNTVVDRGHSREPNASRSSDP